MNVQNFRYILLARDLLTLDAKRKAIFMNFVDVYIIDIDIKVIRLYNIIVKPPRIEL